MPIFGKKREPAAPLPPPPPIPSRTLSAEQVNNALDYEVARSMRYVRPLSILRIVPQVAASDYVDPSEIRMVSEAAGALLRDVDHLGPLDDHSLLAVLPEATADAARTVAHRLAAELTLRSTATVKRNWLVGHATLADDAATAGGLLVAALANALDRGSG